MLTRLLVTTFLFWSEARSGSMPMQKVVPTPTPTPQDVYAKCTESEERFCQRGSDRFHHCTSVTSNTLDPGAPKIVCECQGGFTTPLFQAYEEAFLPSQQCIPCQEEKTVYYGFNLKEADPIRQSMSFDDCLSACYDTSSCNFWSYNVAASRCYLKTRRGGPSRDNNFISGVKNCSAPAAFKESLEQSSILPLVEMFHPTGERSVLQGVPAMFGPHLVGDFTLLGTLAGSDLEDLFCEPFSELFSPKGEFAIARRGNCPFLRKIQVAQMAGFKGVIILDDKKDRKFHRIVAEKSDWLKASFIKIPAVFLRAKETQIFENLIWTGKRFLARLSGSDTFSPVRDGSAIKFPENPDPASDLDVVDSDRVGTSRGNQSSVDMFHHPEIIMTSTVFPEIVAKLETGFSPVAIVFIIATSGLVLLACVFSVGLGCVRLLRYRRRSPAGPNCPAAVGPNGSGTICQTISSANAGSLESLARWIGTDTFNAAGSDTPEMAVILSTLECPVCYELIWPPKKIFQCSKGHIICEVCITNAAFDQRCPSCRENFTSHGTSRNLALENLFANMLELVRGTPEAPAQAPAPSAPVAVDGPAANTRSSSSELAHFRYLPSAPSIENLS